MATYLLFGRYSADALKGISAKRSEEARALIKHGGELKSAYATLGGIDLVMIADLPDNSRAIAIHRTCETDRHCIHHRARGHDRRIRQARRLGGYNFPSRSSRESEDPDGFPLTQERCLYSKPSMMRMSRTAPSPSARSASW